MGNAQFHALNPLRLNIARALRLDFGAGNIAVEVVVEEMVLDIVAVVVGIARKNNKTTVCAAQQISFDFRILDMYSFLSPHYNFACFFIGSRQEGQTDVRPRLNPITPLYSYL
jgi:hypothetical protein